jgi:hypothetical protein
MNQSDYNDDRYFNITTQHTPVSESINSNIQRYDWTYFKCNEQPERLINDFVKYNFMKFHGELKNWKTIKLWR